MKKSLFVLLTLLLLALMLVACGSDSGDSAVINDPGEPAETELIMDFEGFELVIAGWDRQWWEPVVGNSAHEDAMVERMNFVQDSYNVTIRFVTLGSHDAFEQTLPQVMAGDFPFDVLTTTVWSTGPFLANNMFQPLNELPALELDQPFWEPAINQLGTLDGNQYLMTPTFFHLYAGSLAYFYNREIIEELGLESPTELYLAGEWTFEKMMELAIAATQDLTGDGVMGHNDRFGISAVDPFGDFAVGQFLASGLRFIGQGPDGNMELQFGSDQHFGVVRDLNRLFDSGAMLLQPGNENQFVWFNQFTDGLALFFPNTLGLKAYIAMNALFDFGFVPPPRWDFQDTHFAAINHNSQVMGMLANNPNNEMVATIMNAMAEAGQAEVTIDLDEKFWVKGWIPCEDTFAYVQGVSANYMIADQAAIMGNPNHFRDFILGTRGVIAEALYQDADVATVFERNHPRTQALLEDFWWR